MCGRYSFATSEKQLQKQFPDVELPGNLRANYNVAPTQHSYVILNETPDQLDYLTWGLIPFWSKDGKSGGKLINARVEGIASKPSFRMPIRNRRCLVIADSFYEWRRDGKEKYPYRILPKDNSLLVMAGIWDVWKDDNGYKVKSYSIITCPPNKEMDGIHNRMPLIFTTPDQWNNWLEDQSLEDLNITMDPTPDDVLKMYRIPKAVGNVRNNGPELHAEEEENLDLFTQY